MAVSSAQVVVGTTATALNASSNQGQRIYLSNPAGQTVFLGDSTVTTTTGYGLLASTTIKIDVDPYEVVYGIVAGTTATVGVLRA